MPTACRISKAVCSGLIWKRLDQFGATHHVEIRLGTSGFDDLDGSLGVDLYSGVDLLCLISAKSVLKLSPGWTSVFRKEFVVDRHKAGLAPLRKNPSQIVDSRPLILLAFFPCDLCIAGDFSFGQRFSRFHKRLNSRYFSLSVGFGTDSTMTPFRIIGHKSKRRRVAL